MGGRLWSFELAGGDMEEETWRRLYTSAQSILRHGSRIIVTGRSEKIAAFGTTRALSLKLLPREAYWYFFKAIAFGGANPDDEPELASLGMEMAALLSGAFLGANIVGSLMRANLNAQFWRRVLRCVRDFTGKHLAAFGEHPTDLAQRGQPVNIWRLARTRNVVTICEVYRTRSPQRGVSSELSAHDILSGRAINHGKFRVVLWRSRIPPYHTYLASCASQTVGGSIVSKKRPRHARV